MFDKLMSSCTTSDHDVLRGSAARSSSIAAVQHNIRVDTCMTPAIIHSNCTCFCHVNRVIHAYFTIIFRAVGVVIARLVASRQNSRSISALIKEDTRSHAADVVATCDIVDQLAELVSPAVVGGWNINRSAYLDTRLGLSFSAALSRADCHGCYATLHLQHLTFCHNDARY